MWTENQRLCPQLRANTDVRQPLLLSWSGGKDSAMALYELHRTDHYRVAALLTTVTEEYDRISMHGVRRVLLERQAHALGLPLDTVLISKTDTSEQYEATMRTSLDKHLAAGISGVAFGDIFLDDIRRQREDNLSQIGVTAVFPLWRRGTAELALTFIDLGFQAVVTCVDSHHLGGEFAGRDFDHEFLSELPPGVDPCGENGEFHSFVWDGPVFRNRVCVKRGEIVLRDERFYFCDPVPD